MLINNLPSHDEIVQIQNKKFSRESKTNFFGNPDVCGIIFEFSQLYEKEQLIDSLITFANYFFRKMLDGGVALAAKMQNGHWKPIIYYNKIHSIIKYDKVYVNFGKLSYQPNFREWNMRHLIIESKNDVVTQIRNDFCWGCTSLVSVSGLPTNLKINDFFFFVINP